MPVTSFDERPTGIPGAGELPWGSHFGVFYTSQQELLGVLVPFVRAGLEHNELCSWEVEPSLTIEAAKQALAEAVPNLEEYEASGQLEFVRPQQAPASSAPPPEPAESLERRLDRAILAGFDGLRLVRNAEARRAGGAPGALDPRLGRLNVIVAFLYPRAGLAAADLVEVVQDHRFAIVCDAGRREVLAGSEARTAREALARSEEKLQSLFANMSEGFALHRIVLDRQGRPCDYVFLEMNPAFERLTGLAAEKTIGRRVTQVLAGIEKDPTDWIGRYGRVALTGEPMQFESYAEPLGRWYAVSAFSPHRGYFVVTFADITDRKRAEAQRQEAEGRLLVTLRSIGDAVISTDTEGRVVMLNRVAEQLTGYAQAEAAGRPFHEIFNIINENSGQPVEDPVRKVFETGAIIGLANHTALVRRDGTRLSIADSAAPVRGEDGELLGVVLVFRDVTEERRAEKALAESEAKYRTLARLYEMLSRVNESLIRTRDERSLFDQVCQIVAEVGGFPLVWIGLVSGRDIVPVARWGPAGDYLGKIRVEVDGELGAGPTGTSVREDRIVLNDDFDANPLTAPWRSPALEHGFRASAAIPLHRQGKPVGALTLYASKPRAFDAEQARLLEALCADVSYALDAMTQEQLRAQAEAELRDANLLLAEADRRKNEFLAVLSHELRNPLAPIANSLYILDHADPGGDKASRAKQTIGRQVAQLSNLVNDLLDVTRIARNKVHLQKERLELNDLIRRAVEDSRSTFERAGIRLELAEAPRPVVMVADGTRVAQIVGNLLQNAAKFTIRGGHTRVSISSEDHQAIVSVRDNGVGISSENLARLFQPFMQAEHTLDRSKGGLGLGLALVKGLAELHGGSASAHSEGLGKGTEFIVRFPIASDLPPEAGSVHIQPAASRRRVLIVEDNVDAADSLRDALELGDHEVEVAYNGPDGLAKARMFKPEVVFCDIGLPGMDGFEVARAFRADAALKRTLLVALTGYALPEDVKRAQEAGFEGHLAKPPSIEKLYGLLGAIRGGGPDEP